LTDGTVDDPRSADFAVLKMRALVDRGLPQDVIGVRAASRYYSVIELEQLGSRDDDCATGWRASYG